MSFEVELEIRESMVVGSAVDIRVILNGFTALFFELKTDSGGNSRDQVNVSLLLRPTSAISFSPVDKPYAECCHEKLLPNLRRGCKLPGIKSLLWQPAIDDCSWAEPLAWSCDLAVKTSYQGPMTCKWKLFWRSILFDQQSDRYTKFLLRLA